MNASGKKNSKRRAPQLATWRPGYLAALAGVLALVLGVFAWYELRDSRRLMLKIMEAGAVSQVEAVARAGENALRADEEALALVVERLLDNARLLRDLEGRRGVSDTLLQRVAADNALFAADVVDEYGRLLGSSRLQEVGEFELEIWREELAPLYRGEEGEQFFFGLNDAVAAAVARPAGGAVVVQAESERMLALRRTSGTGRLIQEIGENPGVVYMVLQDTLGLLSASLGVAEIGRLQGDAFLEEALAGQAAVSRLTRFEGEEILETALAFVVEGETIGLLRIGLALDDIQRQEARDKLQLVLLVGLLVVLGAVGAGVVTIRQNYALLDEAYGRVQTYSSRILGQMADAVIATDPQGGIEVFNQTAERLFGVAAAAALGRSYVEVLEDDLVPLAQAVGKEWEVLGETCIYRPAQGSALTLAVSTSLVRNNQGEVETVVAVIQDLSEKVAMEANLRRRDRLASMGALASGVAHEVRNPLNAVNVIVQRLAREFEPREEREEYAQLIGVVRDEVERVNRIVKQFLSLARPPQLQMGDVDLEALLQRALRVINSRAAAKGLAVAGDFAGVGRVEADAEQLEQVLLNLLSNAVEATERGEIRLSARVLEDGGVEIAVQDTGAGIPAAQRERIFDLYFTTKAEGTGLGLSLVHRIVSEHGGRIDVESEEGAGTVFTLFLPRRG